MRGEDGRLLVEDYLRHLRDLNPGEDVADIIQRKTTAQRDSRYRDLIAHDEDRKRMRGDFAQRDAERADRRRQLLDACANPDHVSAFRALRRFFTKQRYTPNWVVGGEASKRYHATGEFPLQDYYVLLARPSGQLVKMVYDVVGHGDHVFDGYLLFWGVYFDVVVIRSDWALRSSQVLYEADPKPIQVPVLRKDAWDHSRERWAGKDIRFRMEQSRARGIEYGHTEN